MLCAQVQRYGTHHRSLYPHMCTARARDTYLFTSQVGAPLCCWDKRNMSCPVHESQQLGSFSRSYPALPLQPPLQAATHSAMWLETDPGGDLLIGRADNGAKTPSLVPLSLCGFLNSPRDKHQWETLHCRRCCPSQHLEELMRLLCAQA